LVVNALLTCASGTAEREAALAMLAQRPQKKQVTLAGDKGYDTKDFVADLRACQVTPHVAQNNKDDEVRSTCGPRAILVMKLVSESANEWKKSSVG
jgi:hypothetical protein